MEVRTQRSLRPLLGLAALFTVGAAQADPVTADSDGRDQKLERRVEELAQELQAVRAELQALKAQNQAAAAAAPPQPPVSPQQLQTAAPAAPPAAPAASPFENLSLWGYGELYYTHPTHDAKRTQFDLARAVFGIGYKFDERTLFNSEYEVEHAVSSASDVGEFEVEQFYIDRLLTDKVGLRAGLILMPFGLLNEYQSRLISTACSAISSRR